MRACARRCVPQKIKAKARKYEYEEMFIEHPRLDAITNQVKEKVPRCAYACAGCAAALSAARVHLAGVQHGHPAHAARESGPVVISRYEAPWS